MVIKRTDLDSAVTILGAIAEHVSGQDHQDTIMLHAKMNDLGGRRKVEFSKYEIGRLAYLMRIAQYNAPDVMAIRAEQLADVFEAQLVVG